MRKKRLLWQLYPSYLLIALTSILAVTWYVSISFHELYLGQAASDLTARSNLIKERISRLISNNETGKIDPLIKELGADSSTRITVILPDGTVVGDSENDPSLMDNHSDRPEVISALSGHAGNSIRFSYTQQQKMMYVAIPIKFDGELAGVLRSSLPLNSLDNAQSVIYSKIIIGCLLGMILIALISLVISKRISDPIVELQRGAELFAKGDLKHNLQVSASHEIGALAKTMNKMAAQLYERINTIELQRNEQKAVLASMVESVFVVDMNERILSMNRAAEKLFGKSANEVLRRSVQEVIRNTDLLQFVSKALKSVEAIEDDIIITSDTERFLIAHGAIIRDSFGKSIGALIVLNDVTRIRRLESIRQEFVANVSHEIKTPLTSIKGFVETLLDGAMNDPDDAARFLKIIATQADRLNSIIEDLLTLARIEQSGKQNEIFMQDVKVADILHAAMQTCEMKTSKKNIQLILDCDEDIYANLNPQLIEQAVVNLIENAVNYSHVSGAVKILAIRNPSELVISVIDEGCGIPKEHHERLFERFYRVDKARSRKHGGTGLGLAIVKHITKVHGGDARVISVPGKGSTFSIHIPLA